MDQKEIDALIQQSQGTLAEFSKKQEQLIKNLSGKKEPQISPKSTPSPSPPANPQVNREESRRKGKVMGQLSRVTEESEAGTNMVMGYLENVLTVIGKQQCFIRDIREKYNENAQEINVDEALCFLDENLTLIEELIFNAMDAFQFQDIGRQKLMKVMYTLSRLNDYLNELLGGEEDRGKLFGRQIEQKTLDQDKEKEMVDGLVSNYKKDTPTIQSNDDVDKIIAEYQNQGNHQKS